MEYYYDIEVNFYDYPINYYEWERNDNIERILKIKIIRLESISNIIKYDTIINLEDGRYVVCDTINALAIEVIDKRVVYLSFLKYDDDNYICGIASKLGITNLEMEHGSERVIPNTLRRDQLVQKLLLNIINNSSDSLIKYIYYIKVGKINNNISKSKSYLINDISNNFNDKYYEIYESITDK